MTRLERENNINLTDKIMSIEQVGAGSPEKNPKIIIAELEKSYQDWLKENPDLARKVKNELVKISGQAEAEMSDEGLAIVKIPIGKLSIFGTFCGTRGNQAFGEKALNFLNGKEIEFVVAISDKEEPKITSAIMKISREDGETLSEMIAENEGSLRCEAARIEGWSAFESE